MTVSSPSDASAAAPDNERLLTDFTPATPDFGWYVVNDNVMGGRSDGDFAIEPGELHFSGRTNTRGGGFSSIRTRSMSLDLSNYAGIRLRVKGDGRRYTWRLTTDARWRGRTVSYWADFDTSRDTWTTVDVPFSAFVPQFRGYRLDGPALDTTKITGMGLMIYDKRDGPFDMRLSNVHAYADDAPFSLSRYQWNTRVLVVSADSDDDDRLKQQLDDVASSTDEFVDRDMALVILVDDGTSSSGDQLLTREDIDRTRTALGIRAGSFAIRLIGKDGSVKLSGEAPTPMTEVYALIDTMPMRRRETSGY